MRDYLKFYIDGQWVDPVEFRTLDVDNPTTEQVGGKIALGSRRRGQGGKAARKAFGSWSVSLQGDASTCCRPSWTSTRSAPVISPTRCTRRWAHRRRWPPARR